MGPVHVVALLTAVSGLVVSPVKSALQCPDNTWQLWEGTCYLVSSDQANYEDARSACVGLDAELLVLDTPGEEGFIAGLLPNKLIYLGCTSVDTLQWTCGGSGGPYYNSADDYNGFWDWNYNYGVSGRNCVLLVTAFPNLGPTACFGGFPYVCEKTAVFVEDTTTTTPAPTTAKPAPTTVEPAPTTVEPAPTTVEPALTTVEPAPTTVEPAPTTVEPAPTTVEPAPTTDVQSATTTEKPLTSMNEATTKADSTQTEDNSQTNTPARTTTSGDVNGGHHHSPCLKNHMINTTHAQNVGVCAFSCLRDARCKSFNFFPRIYKCELSSIGMKEAEEKDLASVEGCLYFGRYYWMSCKL